MRKTETDMKNANILQIVLIIALVIGLLTGLYMLAGCTVFKGDTDDKTATLEFDSFDGGGPEYKALIEDASIAEISEEKAMELNSSLTYEHLELTPFKK